MKRIAIALTLGTITFFLLGLLVVTDKEQCEPYPPKERGVSNILYCECDDNEYQKPGHCK